MDIQQAEVKLHECGIDFIYYPDSNMYSLVDNSTKFTPQQIIAIVEALIFM